VDGHTGLLAEIKGEIPEDDHEDKGDLHGVVGEDDGLAALIKTDLGEIGFDHLDCLALNDGGGLFTGGFFLISGGSNRCTGEPWLDVGVHLGEKGDDILIAPVLVPMLGVGGVGVIDESADGLPVIRLFFDFFPIESLFCNHDLFWW